MSNATGPTSVFETMAGVLEQELALLNQGRRSMTMSNGERLGTFAGRTYYRFEVPEDALLRSIESATFTFGRTKPITIPGNVIAMENQFLVIALTQDFGPTLPEAQASWDYEPQLGSVAKLLRHLPPEPLLPRLLLHPTDVANNHIAPFEPDVPPQTPADQVEALAKILCNRVTYLWGPILSGKTRVLALAAGNYLKAGKRVLFVAPSNDQVDAMLLRTVEIGQKFGVAMAETATRYDLPSLDNVEALGAYAFDAQVESVREKKRQTFQERVNLLKTYWSVKVKLILHETFYQRTQEMRERVLDLRRQADAAAKEAVQLQKQIETIQNASIIDRMKKGFSKEDLAAAQKALVDRQAAHKRLQQMHQNLTAEITRFELNAPVTSEETMALNAAQKRIDDLGGLEAVTKAVEEYTQIDEATLINAKRFVATGIARALMDEQIRSGHFDLVIIDDAHAINIPTLSALAALAKEKVVVAGDPFQMGPESLLRNEDGRRWLQKDLFLFTAGTDELNRLFDWAGKNAQWCVLLSSHFATTPKLSLFAGRVIFDDKINVYASPKARGRIVFIDTSNDGGRSAQYIGRRKILPFNEMQTKRAIECVKYAFMDGKRTSSEIGIILPFSGPTLYTKLALRMAGIRNVEVGTPWSFRGRRKKVIVFDTSMAGVDHTVRAIDDRKIGEHEIVRLMNTVFSCVEEDLYLLADMSHFRTVYKDRLLTRFLQLLEADADQRQPNFAVAVRDFDEADLKFRNALFGSTRAGLATAPIVKSAEPPKKDFELEMQMRMMAKKDLGKPTAGAVRNFDREISLAAERILGLRQHVNMLSQFAGGDMIFRNSFMTDAASALVLVQSSMSETEMQKAVAGWYTLVYESPGGASPEHPLLQHQGKESRPRMEVLYLHAFLSADISIISKEGKAKITTEVTRIFQQSIGKPQPGTPTEWASSYVALLGRLEGYFVWLVDQVRK
jgi:hypothetical protein